MAGFRKNKQIKQRKIPGEPSIVQSKKVSEASLQEHFISKI